MDASGRSGRAWRRRDDPSRMGDPRGPRRRAGVPRGDLDAILGGYFEVSFLSTLGASIVHGASRRATYWIGTAAHIALSGAFGLAYAWVMDLAGISSVATGMSIGLLIGLVHGGVVTVFATSVLADVRPSFPDGGAGKEHAVGDQPTNGRCRVAHLPRAVRSGRRRRLSGSHPLNGRAKLRAGAPPAESPVQLALGVTGSPRLTGREVALVVALGIVARTFLTPAEPWPYVPVATIAFVLHPSAETGSRRFRAIDHLAPPSVDGILIS